MLRSIVQSNGSDDVLDTEPAGPSAEDPTRTSEPLEPTRRAPPASDPIPTTRLRDPDRYHVLGEHGRGGLGRVSRVHDRDLGRDIAIKELISRGPVSEMRFVREALITARLEHPGIVPVSDSGRRGRILRRAGIDPDLTAIILKALEPEPERRYGDAGALAAAREAA